MNIQAQVDEHGLVKVSDPGLWGKTVMMTVVEPDISACNTESETPLSQPEKDEWTEYYQTWQGAKQTNWEAIKQIFKEADALDFPRRTHDEIIRDLHEFRG